MTDSLNPINLNILFDALPDAVYLIDPKSSNIIWCNRAGYEDLGLKAHEILNQSVLSLQKDVIGMPQWEDLVQTMQSQASYTFVGRHRHRNGGEISVEINTSTFQHQGQAYILSVARNINKRMALEQELNIRQSSIWFALNEASDGIWEWDLETGYLFFSPQLNKMLGYGPDEMQPNIDAWINHVHPDDLEPVKTILNQHLQGFRANYEAQYRIKNRNGHYISVQDQGHICQRTAQGEPTRIVGMLKNITEQKMLASTLENLAACDFLTGLSNRQNGEQKANELIQTAHQTKTPLCLLVVDLDHFKQVNDLYGHLKGDTVIQLCAKRLKKALRQQDLIYRWGGEEFVIVLPKTDLENAQNISQKLHACIAESDWQSLGIKPVTLSVGISQISTEQHDLTRLFSQADLAAYQAKAQGRNQTVVSTNPEPPL